MGIGPFRIAKREHMKADAERNPWATKDLVLVVSTELLDASVEACLFKQLIETREENLFVERGPPH
jgi:hypothetical protein